MFWMSCLAALTFQGSTRSLPEANNPVIPLTGVSANLLWWRTISPNRNIKNEDPLMGISIWQLLIVLGIVILLFGTKKLRNIGSDLGGAIRGFKKSMSDEEEKKPAEQDNLEGQQAEQTQAEEKPREKQS